jgi:phage-related holin
MHRPCYEHRTWSVKTKVKKRLEVTVLFVKGLFSSSWVNKLLSLLENAGRMGIPHPQALTNAVNILGGKSNKTNSEYTNKKGDVE